MSVQTEIQRLQSAKAGIKSAIEAKGGSVTGATLDTFAAAVGTIPSGGGTSYKYATGRITGLGDIGWDAESQGMYNDNINIYPWETKEVSAANKALYGVVNASNISSYLSNADMEYVPWYEYKGNKFGGFFNIKGLPKFNTSGVTNMTNMFNGCNNLKVIPLLDTSNVTNMSVMFNSCYSLQGIPQLDTSRVTDMSNMFYSGTSLQSIPQLNTSSVTNMVQMFFSCTSLQSIPQLNTSSVTDMGTFFGYSDIRTLIELGGFTNLKCNWNDNYGLAKCPNLTVQSLLNVIDGLYDFVSAGETPTSSQGNLKLGSTNYNKLTAEQIAVGTAKGWTITA